MHSSIRALFVVSCAAVASSIAACSSRNEDTSQSLASAATAAECQNAAAWASDTAYGTGTVVSYQGKLYRCIQGHTSLSNWVPDQVPALWQEVGTADCQGAPGTPSKPNTPSNPGTPSTPNTPSTPSTGTPAPGPSGKTLIGYFAEWGVYGRNYQVKNIDTSGSASKLTHINYAFGNVQNGKCALGDSYADTDKFYDAASSVDGTADTWDAGALRGSFHQLQELKKKYPHLKIMISLGGWTWSAGFSDAASPGNRAAFVQSCVDLFIKNDKWPGLFDGVDIDWEYPAACGNTCGRPEDTQNYTALLAEFRKQLDAVKPGLQLSVAAPAGADKIAKIQVGDAAKSLNFVNLMTYDLHGAWEKTTNFHSKLYASPNDPAKALRYSTDEAVQQWIDGGTPAGKIVVGVPFYGRGWTGVGTANNGLYQPATGGAPGTYEVGIEDWKVLKNLEGSFQKFRDDKTQSFWIFNPSSGVFWSYDDPATMGIKADYIKSKGLGGAMFWELSGDDAQGTLISALRSKL